MCSTYSMRTCSGPRRKTAIVFGASTTSSTSIPRSLGRRRCAPRPSRRARATWLSSGRSGAPGSPGWNSIQAPPTSTRGTPAGPGAAAAKPSDAYSAAAASGSAERERDVVEVVVESRSPPRRARAVRPRRARVRLARSAAARARARRQAASAARGRRPAAPTCSSAPRSRAPLGGEKGQLAAARVGADERERLRARRSRACRDARREIRDGVPVREPDTRHGRASSASWARAYPRAYALETPRQCLFDRLVVDVVLGRVRLDRARSRRPCPRGRRS